MRSRTNVHYLVFHLTIADTITSYITLPMETIWKYTLQVLTNQKTAILCSQNPPDNLNIFLQWHGDNVTCKVLMMVRTGGYILSSLLLVVLSIDR